MASASPLLVIKVKYGETLRRFYAQIINDELNLTMEELRAKILSLFNFPSEADLILTYIDEDGETVTLADAEDLHDILKQSLDPLRITVKLSSEENTTPLIRLIQKTMPKPLHENLAKLSSDLTSKASSSAPIITELVDYFSKVGMSFLVHPNESETNKPEAATESNEMKSETEKSASKEKKVCDFSGKTAPGAFPGNNSAASGPVPLPLLAPPTGVFRGNNYAASMPLPLPPLPLTPVHRGVRCDGCGVYPIAGSRFKSKVQVDYDLCSTCFSLMGNMTEYIKMEYPAIYNNMSMSQLYASKQLPLQQSFAYMLDSRFIQDVNVSDGTIMAPSTPFTKIWRMRNNGLAAWPQKTKLVWIGGDKLSDQFSVELEIHPTGFQVNHELDISFNFISPSRPGRYISYWRMVSPSGHKFGQRVWVLIQVNAPKVTPCRSISIGKLPEIINVDPQPSAENSSKKTVESQERLDLGSYISPSTPPPSAPLESEQETGVDPAGDDAAKSKLLTELEMYAHLTREYGSEETLLMKLDAMGFGDVELNRKYLRINKYDLEKCVEDLCDEAEWDSMMELEEMGFHDAEVNKKLLKDNNGSIKRVVMDLIAREKID